MQIADPLDAKRAFPVLNSKISFTKDAQNKIVSICDKVLENINEDSLLAFAAIKSDPRPDAAKIKTYVLEKAKFE